MRRGTDLLSGIPESLEDLEFASVFAHIVVFAVDACGPSASLFFEHVNDRVVVSRNPVDRVIVASLEFVLDVLL